MRPKSYDLSTSRSEHSLIDYQLFGQNDSAANQPQYQNAEQYDSTGRNEGSRAERIRPGTESRTPQNHPAPHQEQDALERQPAEPESAQLETPQLDLGLDIPAEKPTAPVPPAAETTARSAPPTAMRWNAQSIWRAVLEELKLQLPANEFQTWVRDSWAIAFEDGELIVGVPSPYTSDWLNCRLRDRIQWALRGITQRTISVKFRVQSPPTKATDDVSGTPLYGGQGQGAASVWDGIELDALDLDDELEQNFAAAGPTLSGIESGGNDAGAAESTGHSASRAASAQPRIPAQAGTSNSGSALRYSTQLNAHHTFESFVVGNNNRMAEAAATAVADAPGQRFNPLFIYGGVGLGKTHLLHAIGNRAQRLGRQVLYCSSETFTNDLIAAIRSQSTQEFRNKYRQVDILLIDDIQFIGGKESTQEEFFHTFNELHANGRQIVLTSDRPPKALATLEERLRSRFEGGVQTDISKPDFETRVAILQSKAQKLGLKTSQEVLTLIAERIDSNVRELEGALNQFALQLDLHNRLLTYDEAAAMLETMTPNRAPCPPAHVLEIVANYFDLTIEDLVGSRRTKAIAWPRQIAMYLLREENQLSLPAIGGYLGDRDHTTIRYGVERIAEQLSRDDELRQHVIALRERIYMPFAR